MFRFQLSAFPKCTLEDDYEKLLRSEQGGWIFNSIKRTCDTQTGLTHFDLNLKINPVLLKQNNRQMALILA